MLLTGACCLGDRSTAGLLDWSGSVVTGFGLALSSTAFALQILDENGDTNTRYGQRAFSILLFQDLAIVPLLALIPLLALQAPEDTSPRSQDFGIAVGAIVIAAGRRPLSAQSAVPDHRPHRRARSR